MPVYTVSLTDGTTLANLAVAAGRGPKGDGFTGGSFNASTGIVTFTSNDGLGFATGDLRSNLSEPSPIGDVTPNTGAFTSLSTTGNTIIGGNLTVNGTTTTVNSQTLDVVDKNITVAFGSVDAASANGAGLTVDGAGATLTYVAAGDKWVFNKPVDVTTLTATSADINGGTIDGVTIGGASAGAVTTTSLVATTADINGGTIDGTVIGGSTPAAISGTTGSFSGNLTVDTNTLFVDAANNRVGIGTTSPTSKIHIEGADGTTARVKSNTGTLGNYAQLILDSFNSFSGSGQAYVRGVSSASGNSNTDLTFGTNDSGFGAPAERLRITSTGNVGIGTSTFAYSAAGRGLLEVNGSSSALVGLKIGDAAGGYLFDNGSLVSIGAPAGRSITFDINGERMRITSTGSVGIGTSSPQAKLQVLDTLKVSTADQSSGSVILGDGGSTAFNVGIARWNGATNAAGTGGVGYFAQGSVNAGGHFFYTGDASAGSTTERLRITSTGSVGIGTSSPSRLLDVNGIAKASIFDVAGEGFIRGDAAGELRIQGGTTATTFRNNSNNTEFMRITSTGNVGIGTNNPAGYGNTSKLVLQSQSSTDGLVATFANSGSTGAGIQFFQNGVDTATIGMPAGSAGIVFKPSGNTERARIDASGNLLVGTTIARTGTNSLTLEPANSFLMMRLTGTGAVTQVQFIRDTAGTPVNVGSISTTGTATSYNITSDYRLKEDVQPLVGASDRVLALKPVNFAWKVDGSRVDGFLAHEAQAVVPEAVTGEKDGDEMQAIDQSKLVPLLTAALQEALQKIDALEARITALEA